MLYFICPKSVVGTLFPGFQAELGNLIVGKVLLGRIFSWWAISAIISFFVAKKAKISLGYLGRFCTHQQIPSHTALLGALRTSGSAPMNHPLVAVPRVKSKRCSKGINFPWKSTSLRLMVR
jgi:hypothetical protein